MTANSCSNCALLDDKALELKHLLSICEKKLAESETTRQALQTENAQLKRQQQKDQKEFRAQIEELEQVKHSLTQKTDRQAKMLLDYEAEVEAARSATEAEANESKRELSSKLERSQEKVRSLERDVNECLEREEALRDDVAKLRNEVESLRAAGSCDVVNVSTSSIADLITWENKLAQISEEKDVLSVRLREVEEALSASQNSFQAELKEHRETAARCEAVEEGNRQYLQQLQVLRDQHAELEMELRLAKSDGMAPQAKGNSMFSELDDQRLRAEEEVRRQRTRIEQQKEQIEGLRQQNAKLKKQIEANALRFGAECSCAENLADVSRSFQNVDAKLRTVSAKYSELMKAFEATKYQQQQQPDAAAKLSNPYDYQSATIEQLVREKQDLRAELDRAVLQNLDLNGQLNAFRCKLSKVEHLLSEEKGRNEHMFHRLEDCKERLADYEGGKLPLACSSAKKSPLCHLPSNVAAMTTDTPAKFYTTANDSFILSTIGCDSVQKNLSSFPSADTPMPKFDAVDGSRKRRSVSAMFDVDPREPIVAKQPRLFLQDSQQPQKTVSFAPLPSPASNVIGKEGSGDAVVMTTAEDQQQPLTSIDNNVSVAALSATTSGTDEEVMDKVAKRRRGRKIEAKIIDPNVGDVYSL